jgi:hypothetical protein
MHEARVRAWREERAAGGGRRSVLAGLTAAAALIAWVAARTPARAGAGEGDDARAAGPAGGPRAAAAAAAAAAPESATDFIQFLEGRPGEGKLETGIVSYRKESADGGPIEVDLVAAVHIADGRYYRDLQKRFRSYDRLLYEMLKPKGVEPVRGERPDNLLSFFQRALKDVLQLEFQLDGIDYLEKNFVHADLDPETFFRLQRERGESLLTLLFNALRAELERQAAGKSSQEASLLELLAAFTGGDAPRSLKLIFARQLEDMEYILAGFEGPGRGESVIVSERNKVALKVLEEVVASGHRKIGIFYGAAHMPDLERRLLAMGFDMAWSVGVPGWHTGRRGAAPRPPRAPRGVEEAPEPAPEAPGAASGGRVRRF